MSNSIIKSWNKKSIRFREDGYGCLTDMAEATGKRVNDYMRLTSTQELLTKLSLVAGIPATSDDAGSVGLVQILQGGNEEQGTWAHSQVCIDFAAWCNLDFKIQINFWVDELLRNGAVSIPQPLIPHVSDLTLEQLNCILDSMELPFTSPERAKTLENVPNVFQEMSKQVAVHLKGIVLTPILKARIDESDDAVLSRTLNRQGTDELGFKAGFGSVSMYEHACKALIKGTRLSDSQNIELWVENGANLPIFVLACARYQAHVEKLVLSGSDKVVDGASLFKALLLTKDGRLAIGGDK